MRVVHGKRIFQALCVLLVILSFAVGFFALPLLPAKAPIHWNIEGKANGFGPAWMAAFLVPIMIAFVAGLFFVIPKIEVRKDNLKKFESSYWLLALGLCVAFFAIFLLSLAPNFGYNFNMSFAVLGVIALLFIFMGLLMPSFKQNYFVGVRTPWALADERVWDATHKFSSKVFIAAGVLFALCAFLPKHSFWLILAAILLMVFGTFGYSYWIYQKLHKSPAKAKLPEKGKPPAKGIKSAKKGKK